MPNKPFPVTLAELEDSTLVDLAQEGNDNAFAELVKRYQGACFKQALSILRDRSDAEDEVQNAMWKAFQHIGQFNKEAKFSTWLTRIVVNQCLMRLRQHRRAKFLYMDDVMVGEEVQTLELRDERISPEDALAQDQLAGVLEHEISRIPPLLRNVFVLRDVNELPMPEVAEQLGISVAAAKSRLLRARLELRERMEKHFGRLGPATLMG
ncbi:MAG: sigma-70 family RNA polymerase sigma factor [Bryobacterales bacterium]|nr:sigma-70 family RNA polymerase sigma factor [Bryobacterales bacterium]